MTYATMHVNDALYYIQARLVRGESKGIAIDKESINLAIDRAYNEEPDWQAYSKDTLLSETMGRNSVK